MFCSLKTFINNMLNKIVDQVVKPKIQPINKNNIT